MKFIIPLLLTFTPLFGEYNGTFGPPPPGASSSKLTPVVTEAMDEAIHWLNLLDQFQFDASWSDAGSLFQDVITQEQWVAAMRTIRRPLGYVKTRKISDTRAANHLPYGTRGNFVILTYDTGFSRRAAGQERVTLMSESYGQWRVVSYSLQ